MGLAATFPLTMYQGRWILPEEDPGFFWFFVVGSGITLLTGLLLHPAHAWIAPIMAIVVGIVVGLFHPDHDGVTALRVSVIFLAPFWTGLIWGGRALRHVLETLASDRRPTGDAAAHGARR